MDPQQRQQYHVLHSSIASMGTDQLNQGSTTGNNKVLLKGVDHMFASGKARQSQNMPYPHPKKQDLQEMLMAQKRYVVAGAPGLESS